VRVIQSRYRKLNAPQFWAIGGISSGGWGALNIGLHHLNTFHIFFSHSGYFTDAAGSANSPDVFVQQLSVSSDEFCGSIWTLEKAIPISWHRHTQFHQTLNRLGVANVFYAFPGGHGLAGADYGWNYFHKHLMDSLSYVGAQFKRSLAPLHSP
jgi:enterochelin esterase-like enzyme